MHTTKGERQARIIEVMQRFFPEDIRVRVISDRSLGAPSLCTACGKSLRSQEGFESLVTRFHNEEWSKILNREQSRCLITLCKDIEACSFREAVMGA